MKRLRALKGLDYPRNATCRKKIVTAGGRSKLIAQRFEEKAGVPIAQMQQLERDAIGGLTEEAQAELERLTAVMREVRGTLRREFYKRVEVGEFCDDVSKHMREHWLGCDPPRIEEVEVAEPKPRKKTKKKTTKKGGG